MTDKQYKSPYQSLIDRLGEDGAKKHMAEIRAKRTNWKKPAKRATKPTKTEQEPQTD